jgi:hypothetical protein
MNPDPLSSYKEQTYNPGSPCPSPLRDPFSNFPLTKSSRPTNKPNKFSKSSADPSNPLKLTFSAKRKLAEDDLISEEDQSPPKKAKMDDKFVAMVTNFIQKFEEEKQATRDNLVEATRSEITGVKDELQNVTKSIKEF